ncbi:MAG: dTMP kinase [Paludibacteraceae bacterium]|nr:dTMP kinase [Paludibacteraceae bacterium]
MKGKFIVIEGVDGCGKSTQLSLMTQAYEKMGVQCKYIHFPMLNQGLYGTMVAEFLRGEYGSIEQVHPKLVALLFANDRMEHIETIKNWLNEGFVVLADRYVYSNIAYQGAKLKTSEEKKSLKQWILQYEFEYNQLPVPDCSFFLNVPFEFVQKTLEANRTGAERDYLNGKQDIHEQSMDFQKQVYDEYMKLLAEQPQFINIECFNQQGQFLPKETIHQMMMNYLK